MVHGVRFSGVHINLLPDMSKMVIGVSPNEDFQGVRYLNEVRPSETANMLSDMAGTSQLYSRRVFAPKTFVQELLQLITDSAMPKAEQEQAKKLIQSQNPDPGNSLTSKGEKTLPVTKFRYLA